jgi:hypothetical protein
VLVDKAPELAPEKLDQVAALPLGARLVMDSWSNKLDLIRTPAVPLSWAREKLPLAITPMVPYLRYAEEAGEQQVEAEPEPAAEPEAQPAPVVVGAAGGTQ